MTQLYAHAGQLPTAARLHSRDKLPVPYCRFGCQTEYEDEHHIFVDCPRFSDFCRQVSEEVSRSTISRCTDIIEKGVIPQETAFWIILAAKSLFTNNCSVWPLYNTKFYLGRILRVLDILHLNASIKPTLEIRRQAQFFASLWHLSAIQLTSCIWGQAQRLAAGGAKSCLDN